MLNEFGDGIHVVDSGFFRPRLDAIHVIVERGRVAIVDTGVNDSVPRVFEALAGLGLGPESVDWVVLTHVHLDHAGGAGLLMSRLPAAHYLRWRQGELSVHGYWDAAAVPLRAWREEDAVEALRAALAHAVDSQMMSDVPLGVFLSGGIDSTAIVAFMHEAASRRGASVNTFSMGFADGSYNELPFAREVARAFGTNHREGLVTPDVASLFDLLIAHVDEPFGDVSLFPTFLVSRLAREHVTVALAGDGGDELFGGYDAYQAQSLAARL